MCSPYCGLSLLTPTKQGRFVGTPMGFPSEPLRKPSAGEHNAIGLSVNNRYSVATLLTALAYTSIDLCLHHSLTCRKRNCLFACTERQARHSGWRAPCTRRYSLLNVFTSCSHLIKPSASALSAHWYSNSPLKKYTLCPPYQAKCKYKRA